MKFTMRSLAALAALAPAVVDAASTVTCSQQKDCITFTMTDATSTGACNVGGSCAVEVCMKISSLNCIKYDPNSNEGFSHMCSQSDLNGCPKYESDGVTPRLGYDGVSDEPSCSSVQGATGAGSTGGWQGKCGGGDDVLMCQEGAPGQTLYWILKDGNQDGVEARGTFYDFDVDVDGCTETVGVECFNNVYACGGTAKQIEKERTWAFTIPSGGSCSVCGGGGNPPPPTSGPTSGPTVTPATDPNSPTDQNNSPPNPSPPNPNVPPNPSPPTPGSNGDPHFKTWKNEHYEYHGQCDMVLTKDSNFADGLGLDIQIRTKMVRFWSYIHNAAIRIGHDVIELEGSDDLQDQSVRYWYNMEFQSKDAKTMGGFPMEIKRSHEKMTKIEIDLDSKYPGVKIVMATYKEFVRVDVQGATEEAFGNTVGLLGEFSTGNTLDRNGEIMHDFRQFGSEWQVRPTEHMLFHKTAEPQFPKKCLEPEDPRGERQRRLDESSITMEQAEKACSALNDALDRKDCVYDILATQDMDMAGAF